MIYADRSRRAASTSEAAAPPVAARPGQGPRDGRGLRPSQVPVRAVRDVLGGPGERLATPVRAEMEGRLGADLSDVRLHTGAAAAASAARLGARAYTAGRHVVIGAGGADRHTLTHELAHVLQQRRGPVAGTDNGAGLSVSTPSDRFERQAEATARQVTSGSAAAGRGAALDVPDAPPAADAAVPQVQRTLVVGLVRITDVSHLKDIKTPGGQLASTPELFNASQDTWKKRLDGKWRDNEARKAWMNARFDALKQLIEDKDYSVTVPQAKSTAETLRQKVIEYFDFKEKSTAMPVAAGPVKPDKEETEEEIPAAASRLSKKLVSSGRVFPEEEVASLARKTSVPKGGFLFELELAAEALDADPGSRVQLGPLSTLQIEGYLGGVLDAYTRDKRAGRVGADVVVWRPVSPPGDKSGQARYGAVFTQAKEIKFTSLASEVTKAKNQLEGTNASGRGESALAREITVRGAAYRGVIALNIWDGIEDFSTLTKVAADALRSPYVHEVDVRDGRTGERYSLTLREGKVSSVKRGGA